MRREIVLLILWVFCPNIVAAAEDCSKTDHGTFCMEAIQNDDDNTVTLWAHNPEKTEVTVTVNAKLKNMTSSVKLPHTWAFEGSSRQSVVKFSANPRGAWEWEYSFNWLLGTMNAHHDDAVVYDLPYRGRFTVLQGFHGTFSHTGADEFAVDWTMPIGTPVHATRDGVVVAARSTMNKGGPNRSFADFANFVWIRHPDGTLGSYLHLKQGGVVVKVGDRVNGKQLIGYSGSTGFSSTPHLHFDLAQPIDGFKYRSMPMRFNTTAGIVTPIQGRTYVSP
jgi:murein DD-endopeptidase MepM/ murein hydrolase activator NlpD